MPNRGQGAPHCRQTHRAAAATAGAQGTKVAQNPKNIIAALGMPERLLLFCVVSDTDWQKTGVPGGIVTAMIAKGLLDPGPAARLSFTCEGFDALEALLEAHLSDS